MSKGLSYTQRTLNALRHQGRNACIVEKYVPIPGKAFGFRKDAFGFIDILCMCPERGIIAVQSTSGNCHAAHKRKIVNECNELALEWIKCGGVIEVWSWKKKLLKPGGKAMRWRARVEEITTEMLNEEV